MDLKALANSLGLGGFIANGSDAPNSAPQASENTTVEQRAPQSSDAERTALKQLSSDPEFLAKIRTAAKEGAIEGQNTALQGLLKTLSGFLTPFLNHGTSADQDPINMLKNLIEGFAGKPAEAQPDTGNFLSQLGLGNLGSLANLIGANPKAEAPKTVVEARPLETSPKANPILDALMAQLPKAAPVQAA